MKSLLLAAITCLFFFQLACSADGVSNSSGSSTPAAAKPSGTREPVLVELFTSEGCSNCPPADAQLAFLENNQPVEGAEVITLGFHVDYFDERGWKDAYSSPASTDRQNKYAQRMKLDSMYTPQMVVDGWIQFIGSDSRRAGEAITQAAVPSKAVVVLTVTEAGTEIDIRDIPKHEAAAVFLAAAEDNIETSVKAGGNRGKTLKHVSVVRGLDGIGPLPATQNAFKATVKITADPKWNKDNLKFVAFVQETASGKIIAVGQARAN